MGADASGGPLGPPEAASSGPAPATRSAPRPISATAKNLAALAGAAAVGAALVSYPALPSRVDAIEVGLSVVEAKVDLILCVVRQPEGADPFDCP
ncbi:hypothetical protein LCGC14_2922980 [marine sediment metagenome]|uniref:Uncharacterized protein n=1 Tax=marine sediment metagenome TaxID=412755 RepID=A0A0F8ZVW1_9ZZZZ